VDLIIAGIIPLKIYKNLFFPDKFKSKLHRVGGVYGLINTYDSKILNNTLVLIKIYTKDYGIILKVEILIVDYKEVSIKMVYLNLKM
jgi:hypothetical protein